MTTFASSVGSITGVGGGGAGDAGPPCSGPSMVGASILRWGKSLPLIELFETFMIAGLVMLMLSINNHYTFENMATILKNEGGSPASIDIASGASRSQSVWIGISATFVVVGVILYYLHRRVIAAPT